MRFAVALLAFGALARAGDPPIDGAFERLMRDDDGSAAAERTLKQHPDRPAVIAEAERLLADDKTSIRAKWRVLTLCSKLERGDLVTKALESQGLSARRAAALALAGARGHEEATKRILLAWTAEAAPRDVDLLVEACRKARIAEARPWLLTLVAAADTAPLVFAAALGVLAADPPPELAGLVRKRLSDPAEKPFRVLACFDALASLKELRADELLVPWLKQRGDRTIRFRAAERIGDPAALKAVLVDEQEPDQIVQRSCLTRLMEVLDDAALLAVLRDPRVNRHRWFKIREDVAIASWAVEGSGAEDALVLLDYLVDENPGPLPVVRSEAWLTLWTLTGKMHGAKGEFGKPPPRGGRDQRTSRMRPGVTPAQRREIETLAKDLNHMRRVREAYAAAK